MHNDAIRVLDRHRLSFEDPNKYSGGYEACRKSEVLDLMVT